MGEDDTKSIPTNFDAEDDAKSVPASFDCADLVPMLTYPNKTLSEGQHLSLAEIAKTENLPH